MHPDPFAGIDFTKIGPVGGYWPADEAQCWAPDQDGIKHIIPSYIPLKWQKKCKVMTDAKGVHYLWTGWNNGEGHAKARHEGKVVYIYRFLFQMMTGIKLGRFDYIDHRCDHKACLNYDHWALETPGGNTARGPGRHTQLKPATHYLQREPLDALG